MWILSDLEKKGAVDSASAISLPYARQNIFRVGMKDYRPRALEFLVTNNIVGITEEGKYYLKDTSGFKKYP